MTELGYLVLLFYVAFACWCAYNYGRSKGRDEEAALRRIVIEDRSLTVYMSEEAIYSTWQQTQLAQARRGGQVH